MKKYNLNDYEQSSFIQVPKWLFTENFINLSNDSKMLYALLKERFSLSLKNKWLDENGNIYLIFTRENMQNLLQCKKDKIIKVVKELKQYELIAETRKGLGKPNWIYLLHPNFNKNFQTDKVETSEKPNSDESIDLTQTSEKPNSDESIDLTQTSEKPNSVTLKNRSTELYNNEHNYTNINNNEFSNQSINQKKDGLVDDTITKYKNNLNMIKKNIEYDILKNSNFIETDILDEIIEIMAEVLTTDKSKIKINKSYIDTSLVKDRFKKINSDNIKYIFHSLKNNTSEIKNIRSYLITTIYNSYTTVNSYFATMLYKDLNNNLM